MSWPVHTPLPQNSFLQSPPSPSQTIPLASSPFRKNEQLDAVPKLTSTGRGKPEPVITEFHTSGSRFGGAGGWELAVLGRLWLAAATPAGELADLQCCVSWKHLAQHWPTEHKNGCFPCFHFCFPNLTEISLVGTTDSWKELWRNTVQFS